MTLVWLAQFFVLLGVSIAIATGTVFATSPASQDMLLLGAPFLAGAALVSSYAAMREDRQARRSLARVFTLGLAVAIAVVYVNGSDWWQYPALGLCIAALPFNLLISVSSTHVSRVRRMSGTADTKPQVVWMLWNVQGVFWLVLGVVVIFVPETLVALLKSGGLPEITPELLSRDLTPAGRALSMPGAAALVLAFASFFASREDKDWVWKTYGLIFALVHASYAFAILVIYDGDYSAVVVGFGFTLALLLAVLNQAARSTAPNWVGEDVGPGADGWTIIDLFTGPMLAVQSVLKKRRSTHLYGVGVDGRFRVVDDPQYPPNPFFTAGKEFGLQARFATVTFPDDASFDVRGAGIRLAGAGESSDFDMLMNSGAFAAFSNVVQFGVLVLSKFLPAIVSETIAKSSFVAREGALCGLRRAPNSFLGIHYYSQTVRFWMDDDDVRWLVRWRLVRDPDAVEDGLPDRIDEEAPWIRVRRPDEQRSADYLRRELKSCLEGPREVDMRLQAQFHRPVRGDGLQWYDASVDWNPLLHPWLDVGVVTLEDAMSDADAEHLHFNASHHPPSMSVPSAPGPLDPRSLADSERRIIDRLWRLREWMYSSFGLPRFGNIGRRR